MEAPRRILVVDDNIDYGRTLCMLLQSRGHMAEHVTDAPAAVAAARRLKPTVALLDIGLPGVDGYRLARSLREEFGPALFIAAITAYDSNEYRARSAAAGFDAHLAKTAGIDAIEALFGTRETD